MKIARRMIAPVPQPVISLKEPAPVMFRVNQVGYPVDAPKRALVMVRQPAPSDSFQVRDARGRTMLRGHATGPVRWNRGYRVYTLRFGEVRTPGLYTIEFDSTSSPSVRVGDAATLYSPLADAALAFLQSQRDGPATIPGPMRRRPAHLDDAAAPVYRVPGYRDGRLRGRLVPTREHVDVAGGWFDAGDYLEFVETASFTDIALLYAAREYSTALSNPSALLAEARYGTDWLLKMWSQSRRVLYFQVGIGEGTRDEKIVGDHDIWRLPQADERLPAASQPYSRAYFIVHRPVFAANAPGRPISPNLAGRVAAAFGLCAQVFAVSDPSYATRCLLDGQTIYDQADTHAAGRLLTSVPYAYYDEPEWRDDMALAATELYLGTQALTVDGETSGAGSLPHPDIGYYLAAAGRWINAYIEGPLSGEDSFNLYDVSTLAGVDLVHILETPSAQSLQSMVVVPTDPASLLGDRADQLHLAQRLARHEPFGLANPATNLDTVAHALGYIVEGRLYDSLSGSGEFESLAQSQLGWVLGDNAWGSSFVVGAGAVYPHCLAAQIPNLSGSLDGRGAILTGATVDGPSSPSIAHMPGAPEGFRPCPRHSENDPFRALSGHGLAYLDDVRSPSTSEPSDDLAALTLLATAQLADS